MNKATKLTATAVLMMICVSVSQASSYNVIGKFYEPMTTNHRTEFHGSFDTNWDGSNLIVSNLMGTMNASMQGAWLDSPTNPTMLTLNQNLQQNDNGSTVTATVFRQNNSDVYIAGGYATPVTFFDSMAYTGVGGNSTENAYFTLVFEHDGMGNINSLGLQELSTNSTLVNQMIYGDCSIGSLMGSGVFCMAGEPTGSSAMAGTPLSLEITKVSSVPVPAAAWLFSGALVCLFGANIRKDTLQVQVV